MLPLIKLNSILSLEQHLHKTGFEFDHTVRFTCIVVPIRDSCSPQFGYLRLGYWYSHVQSSVKYRLATKRKTISDLRILILIIKQHSI
jgi:hypothetical protein